MHQFLSGCANRMSNDIFGSMFNNMLIVTVEMQYLSANCVLKLLFYTPSFALVICINIRVAWIFIIV